MKELLVSVIIATYQQDESLRRALDSLSQQTYPLIEIIIVDDNANEFWNQKVRGIVNVFQRANRDIFIRLIVNQRNQGSANTRNGGIQAAKGTYITFLDDDDLYLPSKIENQLNTMVEENADYSITDLQLYYDTGKLADYRCRNYIHKIDPENLLRYHLMYHMTGTDTLMFRREYLLQIGCFPPIDVGDEFYLMKEAICGKGKFAYVPGCDVKAFIHKGEGGLSSGASKIKGENELYQYKKSFFDRIDIPTKNYIRMRHYAVLAYADMKSGKYLNFVLRSIQSFTCSPFNCILLFMDRK